MPQPQPAMLQDYLIQRVTYVVNNKEYEKSTILMLLAHQDYKQVFVQLQHVTHSLF